ncbi:MAG: glycosyltransferase family 39 protein, partial [Anaerolineales bacterium]
MPISELYKRAAASKTAANLVAGLAGIIYLIQAIIYAHTSGSNLDEGAYLYKGLLFASGRYWPYQDYGPWTNHMPLSFLIPGATQVVFPPGLRSGRYFAIFLGLLLLLGLWIVVRRFGGNWWAAAAVAAIALNPNVVLVYSIAVSQIITACMLIWTLVFTLGHERPTWQIITGAVLAGLTITTRENILPLLPLLLIYVFWQHGFRAGVRATTAGIITTGIIHAIFWPGILSVWAGWLPLNFLSPYGIQGGGTEIWASNLSLDSRVYSFAQGLRSNFVPLVGMFCFSPLLLFKRVWKSNSNWKATIFLSTLFWVLFIAHGWASLWKSYCIFCFSGYLMFFSVIGILSIFIINQSIHLEKSRLYTGFSVVMVILVSTFVGYGSYQQIGPRLLELPLPRLSGGQIKSGSAPLWSYLENLLHIEYKDAKLLLPTLAGFLIATILVLVVLLVTQRFKVRQGSMQNFGLLTINIILFIGLILSPTPVLIIESEIERCGGDVISTYEQVGEYLNQVIPPNSTIYWEAGLSVIPMLYLPGVNFYVPQINDGYSYR